MTSQEIRQRFLKFFEERGHAIVPSSSLIPDDKSVLLTTAGMQQFKPYFTGQADPIKDFGSRNIASVQKSFRTSDIDEVGDESHLTFFEMLGNFSFGGYFKKEAIQYAHEFIVKELGLKIDYVSVFKGDGEVPADVDSEKIWKSLGVSDARRFGREDNFWGPTGGEGPCGPTTEIYINGIEVWNLVFNEYYCEPLESEEVDPVRSPRKERGRRLRRLVSNGVDTGMGLERLTMVLQNKKNIFETDLFEPIVSLLPDAMDERIKRIFCDHLRGIAFLISDGVRPSNKEAGYVLRRLLRRVVTYEVADIGRLFDAVIARYGGFYPELSRETVCFVFNEEFEKFSKALRLGLKELAELQAIDGAAAFGIYESYGLPYEVIKEAGGERAKNLTREDFDKEFERHQEVSRAGREKKFGGHGLLLDTGELKAATPEELQKATRLHTATHLLHQALRVVLGPHVKQMGSDITGERLRFDFTHPQKLTGEEKQKIEDLVNQKIKEDLPIKVEQMKFEVAVKQGALAFFKQKYPDTVKVYGIEGFSKEVCGGPHVSHTGEVGKFRIIKEESSSAGVRRVRATVE